MLAKSFPKNLINTKSRAIITSQAYEEVMIRCPKEMEKKCSVFMCAVEITDEAKQTSCTKLRTNVIHKCKRNLCVRPKCFVALLLAKDLEDHFFSLMKDGICSRRNRSFPFAPHQANFLNGGGKNQNDALFNQTFSRSGFFLTFCSFI